MRESDWLTHWLLVNMINWYTSYGLLLSDLDSLRIKITCNQELIIMMLVIPLLM